MIKTKKLLVKLNTVGKQLFPWPVVQYKIAPSSAGAYAKYLQEEAAVWKQFLEIQNEKAQHAKKSWQIFYIEISVKELETLKAYEKKVTTWLDLAS